MTNKMTYISYLLRLWLVEEDGEICWRASLQSSQGGGRTGFRSLAHLFAFLEDQTKDVEDRTGDADGFVSSGKRGSEGEW